MIALPQHFQDAMQDSLGKSYDDFVESLNKSAPTSIRINPLKQNRFPSAGEVPWSQFGRYLSSRPSFTLDPHFHAGAYYVQEASSMFLEQAVLQTLPLDRPLAVLDLCAAPGGKSTHLLSLLSPDSLLVSNEVIRSRASVLSENILKWGNANTLVTNSDPENFSSLTGMFDAIVVDAPCSGEGLFRKDPAAVKEWSVRNVELCAARQRRIVQDVWPALKEDGILIYCTCTYNRLENEENLKWLAEQHDLEFVSLQVAPSWGVTVVEEDNIVGYRFYPHRVGGEGFFLSIVRKRETAGNFSKRTKSPVAAAAAKVRAMLSPWLKEPERFAFYAHGELVFAFPQGHEALLNVVRQHATIVHAGLPLAELKHDKPIPHVGLALSTQLNTNHFPVLALDTPSALAFLRRENFTLELAQKGFHLITFEQSTIGWINSLVTRFNNLYPVDWRIRMRTDQ